MSHHKASDFNSMDLVSLIFTRGLIPMLSEGSARATDTDTIDEILSSAIVHAKKAKYCISGDAVVALHRIGHASVIKIVDVK